jgi:hypothetical protein
MREIKSCPLYRKSEGLGFGKGIGYCDYDSGSITCEGDVDFCERLDDLKKYLMSKLGSLESRL